MLKIRVDFVAARLAEPFILAIGLWSALVPVANAASTRPVAAEHGMVVTAQHLATGVGVDILKRGGNAVDAAIAVGYALAVVYPAAGNLGGGGFMTIRFADGRRTFLDFRETAPRAASRAAPVAAIPPDTINACPRAYLWPSIRGTGNTLCQ